MIGSLAQLAFRASRVVPLVLGLVLAVLTPQLKADTKAPSLDGVQRIDQLWMIVFVDKGGVENLAQAKTVAGDYVPLIAADLPRLESMLQVSREMARALNREMRLIKFTNRVDLEQIRP